MSWTIPIYSSPQEPAMSRSQACTEHLMSDARTTENLVDRCAEYSGRIRTASRMAESLGDQNTAAFCQGVSRDMDKTLWMLTSIQVA